MIQTKPTEVGASDMIVYCDSLQTAGGSAVTNSAKSLLIAVFFIYTPIFPIFDLNCPKILEISRIICGDFLATF